jgi:gliding motility-associated lipoprotein GldH
MSASLSVYRFTRRLIAVSAVGFIGLLTSCDRNRVFEDNLDLKDYAWRAKEKPSFSFPITDTTARYNVYLNVRTTTGYQFYNLFVKLTLVGPDNEPISRRLHEMNIRNPQTGEPLGNGAGDIFDNQFLALSGLRFRKAGTYKVDLEQYMRLAVLPDVMDVGIRVARQSPEQNASKSPGQ